MKPKKSRKNTEAQKLPEQIPAQDELLNAETGPLKEESLRWIFTIFCSILVYIVIARIVLATYHPDLAAIEKAAREMFFDVGILHPEPVEAMLFRIALLLMFPLIIGFYILFSKATFIRALTSPVPYWTIAISVSTFISGLLYAGLVANNPFGSKGGWTRPENNRDNVATTNVEFYFKGLFTGAHPWVYFLVLVPLVAILFFVGIRKYKLDSKKYFRNLVSVAGYPVVGFAVIAIVLMNAISFPQTDENKFDFNAVYYSMTQVFAGAPMLVSGFTNTYGLYPHFLNPLFQIIGLNVFKFATTMSVLLGFTFVLNFIFMRQFIRNRVLLFLGFASILFFPYLDFKILTIFDCLFSLYPIRYLAPSLLCFLAMRYYTKPSVKLYWLTFILMALCVLWNPDIGMVSFITWVISLVYNDFYDNEGSIAIKKIGQHLLTAIAVILGVFVGYMLFIYVFYGNWPNMWLLFSTMGYFGIYGVGLLPMSLIHPWNISVLILLSGFMFAITKWYHKDITPRATIMLLVSMIATGYFVYFQGRSQNSNFSLSSSFTLVLLVFLMDEMWEKARHQHIAVFHLIFVVGLSIISFSYFEIIMSSKKIKELVYQYEDQKAHSMEESLLEDEEAFIVSKTAEKEKMLLLTVKKYQGLMFGGHKRLSSFNPGLMDMFLRTNMAKMEQTIIDSSSKIFVSRNLKLYEYLERTASAIAATYELDTMSKRFALLKKRRVRLLPGTFLNDRENVLLHRKYTDDTAGINRRIKDAVGTIPVQPDSMFSVEAIFFATQQPLEFPTIITNIADSSGFAIGLVNNAFYFGVNAVGASVQLPFNTWVYVAMNVYPHAIDIFANGRFLARPTLTNSMRPSKLPVRVGALKNYNYYIGGIAEVNIANKVMDSATVRETWERINMSLRMRAPK